jgi:hypothetical protein
VIFAGGGYLKPEHLELGQPHDNSSVSGGTDSAGLTPASARCFESRQKARSAISEGVLRNGSFDPIITGSKMARPRNPSRGERFEVTLSAQSVRLLHRLAEHGLYGRTPAEVGGRFIEQALQQFVEPPQFPAESSDAPADRRSKR